MSKLISLSSDKLKQLQIDAIQFTMDNFFNGKLSGLNASDIYDKLNTEKIVMACKCDNECKKLDCSVIKCKRRDSK